MLSTWIRTYKVSWFRTLVVFGTFLFIFPLPIHAVNPDTGSTPVTATVPAPTPTPSPSPSPSPVTPDTPAPPILISPSNNAIINSNSPTFIFESSTDEGGIHKYEFWLNGIFDHELLHTGSNTHSTTASSALTEGLHTWKVKAVNNSGYGTDSATFSFTVDTTPPIILITGIAENQVSLSSQDPSTIPANYSVSTTDITPTISGSSEANAVLVFSLSGSVASYTLTTTANSSASFSLTPNFQLASDTYTVSVTSSDQASNSSSLPSFTLIIIPQAAKTPSITIPLPSPFKDITIPGLPIIPQPKLPVLPKGLTAYPLTPESPTFLTILPWLIILLFIIHLIINKRIILYLNLSLLLYLFLTTWHWLPILVFLPLLAAIIYLKKQTSSE